MIISVSYDELPDSIDSNASQTVEFSFFVAVLAKLFQESAVRVEDLDTMVRGIGYDDCVIRTDGDTSWPCEASGFAPPTTDLIQLLPLLKVLTSRGGTDYCVMGDTCNQILYYIQGVFVKNRKFNSSAIYELYILCL